jgi:hypothetical protein
MNRGWTGEARALFVLAAIPAASSPAAAPGLQNVNFLTPA